MIRGIVLKIVGLFALVAVIALDQCDAKRFPVLHPKTGPGTAYPCGLHAHMCSDGGCCGNGFECTSDRVPSMYAYPGYCRWTGEDY